MPEYEVSVSAFDHITVEADSAEEAAEEAERKARSKLPGRWQVHEVHPGAPLSR